MNKLVFILLFSICLQSFGQQLKFERLPDGISQKSITTILRDNHGFMWFGTKYGLNKFDGIRYETFNNVTGAEYFESSYIIDLILDDQGDIWIASEGSGISKFIYKENRFVTYRHDPKILNSISSDNVNGIYIDSDKDLWVATATSGLNKMNPETGKVERYWSNTDDPNSLSHNDVTDVIEDDLGNLWIGTWEGINLYDKKGNRFVTYKSDDTPNLGSDQVRKFFKSSKGLWVGCQNGIYKIDYHESKFHFNPIVSNNHELQEQLYNHPVMAITEDQTGKIWIGTENGDIFIYDPITEDLQKHLLIDSNGSIISKSIWSLYTDPLGTVWIGAFNGGVAKYDANYQNLTHIYNRANKPSELSHNMVSCFHPAENGRLWIGTDGGGLNLFDPNTNQIVKQYDVAKLGASNAIVDLLTDKNDNLWMATWKGGVVRKKHNKEEFKVFNNSNLRPSQKEPYGNDIFDMLEDDKGNIWIAAFRDGISIYLTDEDRFIELKSDGLDRNSLPGKRNVCMMQDHLGRMWVGSQGQGLSRIIVDQSYKILDRSDYLRDNTRTSLGHNIVIFLLEDSQNNIWVGTEGGGLNLYNEATDDFERITTLEGLPSNLIYSIEEDNDKKLWISTNKGLCRFDPENRDVKVFDQIDGIQSSEFISGSSIKTADGELYFGGIKGFNRFYPSRLTENQNIPEVYITEFAMNSGKNEISRKFGQLIEQSQLNVPIKLAHDENDFQFDFAVLNYSQSSKNKYAYMLEGYDEDWIFIDQYSPARYANVPPGKYTFHVKGSNNNDIWNQTGSTMSIIIAKPWWGSYWAYAVYGLLVISILGFTGQNLIRRERLKRDLQIEHMELSKMMELDELKSRFFANISHEFRTPLTLILGPLKSLLNKTFKGDPQGQYKIMERNAERLLRLINQLLDLSKLESGNMKLKAAKQDIVKYLKPVVHSFTSYAEKQYIDYKCNFPSVPIEVYFEKDKVEKIIVNLLSNAFKYTAEFGRVFVDVSETNKKVIIQISDTGVGIEEEQIEYIFNRFYQAETSKKQKGTGIGLALTKELVDLHHGEITVKSEAGKGTTFYVELPKGKDHLTAEEISQTLVEDSDTESIKLGLDLGVERSEISLKAEDDQEDLPIILIAEDNEDMRAFIGEHLFTNYKIIEAQDGNEAFSLAKEHIPDVIISDILMPNADGYELCKKVRAETKTSHIPIILLTAKASTDSAEKGFEIGADYYVTKPFNPKLLELRVRNILKARESMKNQLFNKENLDLEPKEIKIASKDQEFLKQLMSFIEENMDNSELNVDHVCREMGLSRTQLYRKLKALVGQSANEFIRSLRLKRAAQLLKQNEMTIAEVTYQVGFNDLQYFRFCFKKQFGVNPSEYNQKMA